MSETLLFQQYPDVSKLHVSSSLRCLQNLTATTINTTTNSSVNSCCSSYSSGSSNTTIQNVINSSSSSNNNNNIISKFIDIAGFLNFITKSIILDCRLLKEFDVKHIKNSVHINCRDKITKKRLSTKKLSVKDIIGCEETKKKIDCGLSTTTTTTNLSDVNVPDNDYLVVIYDDSTSDDNDLYLDQNPLQIVLENIKHTFKNNNCKILKGKKKIFFFFFFL
jgi:hypothetical protein